MAKSDCIQAHKEYKKKKIPETYCGFIDGQVILCCPQIAERISVQSKTSFFCSFFKTLHQCTFLINRM